MPKFIHDNKEHFVSIEHAYAKDYLLELVNEALKRGPMEKITIEQLPDELCEEVVNELFDMEEDTEDLRELYLLILNHFKKP